MAADSVAEVGTKSPELGKVIRVHQRSILSDAADTHGGTSQLTRVVSVSAVVIVAMFAASISPAVVDDNSVLHWTEEEGIYRTSVLTFRGGGGGGGIPFVCSEY